MCRKTPAVAYYEKKLKITKKTILFQEWEEAPLTEREKNFLKDVYFCIPLKILSENYGLTISGISKFKKKIFEKMHNFDIYNNQK